MANISIHAWLSAHFFVYVSGFAERAVHFKMIAPAGEFHAHHSPFF